MIRFINSLYCFNNFKLNLKGNNTPTAGAGSASLTGQRQTKVIINFIDAGMCTVFNLDS